MSVTALAFDCNGCMPPACLRPTKAGRKEDFEFLQSLGFDVRWTVSNGYTLKMPSASSFGKYQHISGGEGFGIAECQIPHAIMILRLRDAGWTVHQFRDMRYGARIGFLRDLIGSTHRWDYGNVPDIEQQLAAQEWLLIQLGIKPDDRRLLEHLARKIAVKARKQDIRFLFIGGGACLGIGLLLYTVSLIAAIAVGFFGACMLLFGLTTVFSADKQDVDVPPS